MIPNSADSNRENGRDASALDQLTPAMIVTNASVEQ